MGAFFDHLDEKRKGRVALVGGAILFFVEAGLQVSGVTNLPLALILWGMAGLLCLYWLSHFKFADKLGSWLRNYAVTSRNRFSEWQKAPRLNPLVLVIVFLIVITAAGGWLNSGRGADFAVPASRPATQAQPAPKAPVETIPSKTTETRPSTKVASARFLMQGNEIALVSKDDRISIASWKRETGIHALTSLPIYVGQFVLNQDYGPFDVSLTRVEEVGFERMYFTIPMLVITNEQHFVEIKVDLFAIQSSAMLPSLSWTEPADLYLIFSKRQ